jgi:hypothetical protein
MTSTAPDSTSVTVFETMTGLERLVQYICDIEAAMGDGVKTVYESEYAVMQKLRRIDRLTLGVHAVN